MRVLMVSPFPALESDAIGGVEAAALALCDGIARSGQAELRVASLSTRHDRRTLEQRSGYAVSYLPYRPTRETASLYARARELIVQEADGFLPDVVHGQGADAHGHGAMAVGALVHVITPHGNLWQDDRRGGDTPGIWMRGAVRQWMAVQLIRRADVVVAVGDPHANGADSGRRVVEIPNAVRADFEAPAVRRPRTTDILVPAAVKRVKGIERVIEAAGIIAADGSRVVVRVAGGIDDLGYRAELATLAAEKAHVDVEWLGHLSTARMVDAMDHASAVVLGSSFEVSPVVVGEAMFRERPVVAPDLAGLRRLVGEKDRALLYPVGDVSELARRMRLALGESYDGTAARSRAAMEYSATSVAMRTLAVYQAVLAEKREILA
jgi:glycosyltransferase involved in cell wall biosynthesis